MRIALTISLILFSLPCYAGLIDDFNRAEVGPLYIVSEGAIAITSNTLGGTTTGENFHYYNVTYGEAQYAYLTLAALPGDNEGVSFFGRLNTSTWNGYDFQIQRRAAGVPQDELRLFQYDGGAFGAQLGSYPWNTWQVGDKFGFQFNGSSIKCYAMAAGTSTWVEIISVTNSAYIQSGKFAFGMFSNNARWDDLSGGDDGNAPFLNVPTPILQGVTGVGISIR